MRRDSVLTRQDEGQPGRVLNRNRTPWVRNEPVGKPGKLLSWSNSEHLKLGFVFCVFFPVFSTVCGSSSPGTAEQVSGGLLGVVCPWRWAYPHAEGSDSPALLFLWALAGCWKGVTSGG